MGGDHGMVYKKNLKNSSSHHCSLFTIQILISGVDEEMEFF
jgi:hypothetical protein